MEERYAYMFENEVGCDVVFSVGQHDRRVAAHQFILISKSAVFEAMFCGSLAENTGSRVVKIPDVEEEIFLQFLKFIYRGEIALDDNNCLPILYVARKYCVEDLVRICVDYLRSKMKPDTVCEILEQAHTYDIDNLKDMCLQYIYENALFVLQSEAFTDLCFDCVMQIVRANDLFVEESDVYTALTSWAASECRRKNFEITGVNRRQVLGKLLFRVRFPTMDRLFFTDIVAADDILTESEKIMLFRHMFGSSPKQEVPFPDIKREARVIKCIRFPKNESGGISCEPGFKNSNFGIDVRSSEEVMLQGIVLFGVCSTSLTSSQSSQSDSGNKSTSMTTSITDQHIKVIISSVPHQSESYTFVFDSIDIPEEETYNLFLKEPVLLRKGRWYAVQVKLDLFLPYQTFSGVGGLPEVDSGSIRFTFGTHQSLIATTTEKGQIAGLLFSKLPDPDRQETSLSPRGSPVKKDSEREFRPIFMKRDCFT